MCNQILLETSIRKGHITFDSIVSFNFLRFAEMLRKKSYFFQVHVYLVTHCLKFAKSEEYIIRYHLYSGIIFCNIEFHGLSILKDHLYKVHNVLEKDMKNTISTVERKEKCKQKKTSFAGF